MATLEEHLGIIESQLECLEEQGHIKNQDEFWAIEDINDGIIRLKTDFIGNQRILDGE